MTALRHHLLRPLHQREQPQHAGVGVGLHEVGVLHRVAAVGEGEAHPVGRELVDGLAERHEVAGGLAHLLGVEEQVAIGPDALHPAVLALRPHRHVVVHGVRQVVGHQVLPGHPAQDLVDYIIYLLPEIKRIPVGELLLHLGKGGGDDGCGGGGGVQEHVVPHLVHGEMVK